MKPPPSWVVVWTFACAAAVGMQPEPLPAAPADPRAVETTLRAALEELRDGRDIPGASLAASFSDGRVEAVAVGLADPRSGEPMTIRHRLLAGSQGKTFVAAVALGLVEEQRLDLDGHVSRWLGGEAWYPRLPNGAGLTLRQLMNHTSGLPDHLEVGDFWAAVRAEPDRSWRADELLSFILDKPPLFEPGADWAYSDTNYIVVGAVVERVTGRSYYELLRERVLRPRSLEDLVPQESRRIDRLAAGVTRLGERFGLAPGPVLIDGRLPFNPQMEWCGGGVAATTPDLARWAHAWFSGSLVQPGTLGQLLDGVPAKTGPGQRYGLGVQLRDSPHGPVRFHGGWFPGYMGEMAYYPERGVAMSILVNTDAGVGPRVFQRLFDELVGKLVPPPAGAGPP